MKKLETYVLEDGELTPSLENIQECVHIAKEHDCFVELIWIMKWSGKYSRIIGPDDDPQDFYDKRIPKVYGM